MTISTIRRMAALLGWLSLASPAMAAEPADPAVAWLKSLDVTLVNDTPALREGVRREAHVMLEAANGRETTNWRGMKSREDWERYRDERLAALRKSLGTLPEPGQPISFEVTHRIEGDGFVIENILFTSRPDVVVTANLYRPAKTTTGCPGIILCHSHHAPKTQGELQTMGMTWARQGAVVLVMDQLGHGERRTHRFNKRDSYSGEFRPERQDYYFRYNTAAQLHLVGESLIGWMVGDLMRGVDLLTSLAEVDRSKIILLGAVAGGGDPAGVTAALDRRIAAAVPFNFGGYEPEDQYPLPENAEETFDFAGSGSWESTRNLRLSARDGFQPWMIVGATAPRRLVYAHEFRWDEPRDPVWKRLQQIFAWHDVPDHLTSVVGRGTVKGSSGPTNTHCTNIGAIHREQLYPAFEKWFSMPPPVPEYTATRPSEELMCVREGRAVPALHETLTALADQRLAASRMARAKLSPAEQARRNKSELESLIGDVQFGEISVSKVAKAAPNEHGIEIDSRVIQQSRNGVGRSVPVLFIRPAAGDVRPNPSRIVVGFCQAGKAEMLKRRADVIVALVRAGAWVVLPDLYATGVLHPDGEGRGRQSGATSRSASLWMLGETVLGRQVNDARAVLVVAHISALNAKVTLWGESFVEPNETDRDLAAPLDAASLPRPSEPMGAHVALLAALWDPNVDRVYAAGGLASYRNLLEGPYLYCPHDALIPGVLATCDVPDWLTWLGDRKVYYADTRDGLNRSLQSSLTPLPPKELATWLLGQ